MFAEYFWHSEGRTHRNEVLMEAVSSRVAGSKIPWIIACDRTMEPDEFQQGEWVHRAGAEIIGPSNAETTYRTEAVGNDDVEITLHYFVVCGDINMKMQHMDVVEDCESKVHKPIRCEVRLHCIEKKGTESSRCLSLYQMSAASTKQIKWEQIKEIKVKQVRPKKKEEMTTSVRKNGKLGRHEVAHVIKHTRIGQYQNGKEDCRRVNDPTDMVVQELDEEEEEAEEEEEEEEEVLEMFVESIDRFEYSGYRTRRLCSHNLAGRCERGRNCTFAHGEQELHSRSLLRADRGRATAADHA